MRNALIKMISKRKLTPKKKKERSWDQFFSRAMIRFSLYNIYYRFDDNAYYSGTYRVKTTENLFSTNNHQLLFYTDDLKTLKLNNDEAAVLRLNTQLNTLSKRLNEKGIKLIVLPSPDKLDIYYDYISNKSKYPRPVFFDLLDHLQKNYLYINSKQILGNAVKTQKDIYFYDDTHWSPFAAKIIGGELDKVITNTR